MPPAKHKAAKASTAGRTAVADAEAGGSSSGNSSAAADGASSSGRNWLLRVPSPAYTIPGAALLLVALALGLGLGLPPLLQRSRGRALGPAAGADAYAVDGWPAGGEADLGRPLATLFVVGDWGRQGNANQLAAAQLMDKVAQRQRPDAVISTGDNMYPHGLQSARDVAQFAASFSRVYSGPGLAGVPWYAVLGNHDQGDGIDAYNASIIRQCVRKRVEECRGSAQCCFSPEWQLQPAVDGQHNALVGSDPRWHQQRTYNLSLAGGAVQLLLLDTSPFIAEYFSQAWALNPGGLAEQDPAAQRQAIERWLAETSPPPSSGDGGGGDGRPPWRLVVGHHPLASNGGDVDKGQELAQLAWLKQLLLQHGVPMYLNGHEHNLELIQEPGSKLYMMTSGAGSDVRPMAGWGPGVRFQAADQGFVAVRLFSEHALLEFYTRGGRGAAAPDYAIAVPRPGGAP